MKEVLSFFLLKKGDTGERKGEERTAKKFPTVKLLRATL